MGGFGDDIDALLQQPAQTYLGDALAVCLGNSHPVTTVVFAFLDQYVSTAFLHILLKIVIDVAMYVINYRIQKAWVFPQYRTDAPAKGGKK